MTVPTVEPKETPAAEAARASHSEGDRSSNGGPAVTSALLQNPLVNMSEGEVIEDADAFVTLNGLTDHTEAFRKGALLAKAANVPQGYRGILMLTGADQEALDYEENNRWGSQPRMLYFLCALCAGCAIVQGMDQTAINGAQVREASILSTSLPSFIMLPNLDPLPPFPPSPVPLSSS